MKLVDFFKTSVFYFFFVNIFIFQSSLPSSTLVPQKIYLNINLPDTQTHNYHLFDEQEVHYKKAKVGHVFSNGYSVLIPFFLAMALCCFCFFFVNFLWRDDLYNEIFGAIHACEAFDFVIGIRNFYQYLILSIWLIYMWFEHIKFETNEGYHIKKVNTDYKIGFVLFLMSEVMFFFSIFWAFFHFAIGLSLDIGFFWPPQGIDPIPFENLPLLNTFILITSGLFVTWSQNALKIESYWECFWSLLFTILLGILFLSLQSVEYFTAEFNLNDSVFGSIFFFGTGFHGIHVFLGTFALIYNLLKLWDGELCASTHLSYLFTIWYWHFVDVVWLFLYIIFYVLGQ